MLRLALASDGTPRSNFYPDGRTIPFDWSHLTIDAAERNDWSKLHHQKTIQRTVYVETAI